jgi:hypothetical protein
MSKVSGQVLGSRHYGPATGQFLSVDPLVAQTGHPYQYAGDDPVNNSDPSGDISCPSFVPGCGVVTDVQHHWRGITRTAIVVGAAVGTGLCVAASATSTPRAATTHSCGRWHRDRGVASL